MCHGTAIATVAGYDDVMLSPGTNVFADIFRAVAIGYGATPDDIDRAIAAFA